MKTFKKSNEKLQTENEKLKLENQHFRKGENLPKKTQIKVARDILEKSYSPAKVDFLISGGAKKRSKKWSTEDKNKAYDLLGFLSLKDYEKVRKITPLPGSSTLQKAYAFLSCQPGFQYHVFTFITEYMSKTESWKNGVGNLCGMCFDEMSLSPRAMYDPRDDAIVGKGSFEFNICK